MGDVGVMTAFVLFVVGLLVATLSMLWWHGPAAAGVTIGVGIMVLAVVDESERS